MKEWLKYHGWFWLKWMLFALLIWVVITSTIYRFKHPDKTETEAFLHIPRSFILDFS